MQKTIERLIPHDKALHIIAGAFITSFIISSMKLIWGGIDIIPLLCTSILLSQIPIFIKEFYDQRKKEKENLGHGFSWLDILFGEVGIFAVLLFTYILLK